MANLLNFSLTVLIWGANFYAIEFQLGVVPVEVSLAYRYALATAVAFGWCLLQGKSLRFGLAEHRYFVLLGLFLFGFNYELGYHAQTYITSALNAMCFSAMVWMNVVNARVFFGTRITGSTYIGAGMGMTGIVIIFWPEVDGLSLSDGILIGAFFSMLGALLASFGNIASQAAQRQHIPVMQASAWGMFYGTLLNGGLALARGEPFVFDQSFEYISSLLFLAIFGSVVSFACYLTLMGRIGLEKAGYAAVMVPVVALILSALFEGLQLEAHVLTGSALAVAGNIFILTRGARG